MPKEMKVGIAWYVEDEWERLRGIATDSKELEETYAAWLEAYEAGLRVLREAGIQPERVEVRVADLQAWCLEQGRAVDAAARSEFASELLRRRYEAPLD